MIAEKMKPFVQNNSAIRMMFEEGNRLRAKYGANKVYDFSLGNPSVPAPDCVREAIIDLVYKIFRKESDHDSWRCQRSECHPQDDTESGRGSDRFCTVLSGIRCICT